MTYHKTLDTTQLHNLPIVHPVNDDSLMENTRIKFHTSVAKVTEEWDAFVPEDRLFLRTAYLRTLETAPPEGMQFCYVSFTVEGQPIGVAACQIQYFKGDETFNEKDDSEPCFFKAVSRSVKNFVAKKIGFHTLVCGSLLLTGEHGFYFHPQINASLTAKLLVKGFDKVMEEMDKQGVHISLTLMKDFFEETRAGLTPTLTDKKFYEFKVQPNMILDLRSEWNNFEDYKAAMSSKYRVRVKRAFKKGKNIVRKELDASEIETNKQHIFDLYKNVSKNAGFNTFTFTPDYFPELKRQLKDRLKLIACYQDEQFVGFYTTILDGHELEAHFLGFDYEVNRNTQLYLNMLYDMIRIGIDLKVNRVVFSRTALEIKSSVGAEPHEMYFYLRHRNAISNRFVTNFMEYLRPNEEWTQRHPFK